METEGQHCAEGECRHLTALKHVKTNVRKISHELSQPLMVIQGYLELFELGKFGDDAVSMKGVLECVAGQMGMIQEIHGKLKEMLQHNTMESAKTNEGGIHDTGI